MGVLSNPDNVLPTNATSSVVSRRKSHVVEAQQRTRHREARTKMLLKIDHFKFLFESSSRLERRVDENLSVVL